MKRDFRDNKAHNINEITCTGIDKDPPPLNIQLRGQLGSTNLTF